MARRVLTDEADRHIRDKFKLKGWVQKPKARRERYFAWCEESEERLRKTMAETGADESEDPPDEAMMHAVTSMLKADKTLEAHVKQKDAEFLADQKHWEQIYRAASGTIYNEYLVAVEKDEWPSD